MSDINERLIEAASDGENEVVKTLIKNGADVNAKNKYGYTVLILASDKGNLDLVKTLIDNGADVNFQDSDGWTALMMASGNGYTEIVKTLIENGSDVNAKDKDGKSALIWASEYINNDVVKTLLIDYQAKVSDEDIKKLKDLDATFTLDLIAKRDFEKHLQQELRQIPETPSKKKSLSMKI